MNQLDLQFEGEINFIEQTSPFLRVNSTSTLRSIHRLHILAAQAVAVAHPTLSTLRLRFL